MFLEFFLLILRVFLLLISALLALPSIPLLLYFIFKLNEWVLRIEYDYCCIKLMCFSYDTVNKFKAILKLSRHFIYCIRLLKGYHRIGFTTSHLCINGNEFAKNYCLSSDCQIHSEMWNIANCVMFL